MRFPHLFAIKTLPLYARIVHPASRRHILMLGTGVGLCFIGSAMAQYGHHQALVPVFMWDAISYTIHGCGLVPMAQHFEAGWRIVFGDIAGDVNTS